MITPWSLLSSGPGMFDRVTGGASFSSYTYRMAIDSVNPNLPQRLIQPVLLCPGSIYALSFQTRRTAGVGSIVVTGGVQFESETLVKLVGNTVSSLLFTAATSLTTLIVPPGPSVVAGVVVIEAIFYGPNGVKEVFIDDVVLSRLA